MIDILTLAYYSMGTGGFFGNLMFMLDQNGFFSYGLPFLMIFMISFGILSNVKLFGDNKAINIVLSLVIGFMALQLNFVSYFFSEIFPRMGVLLSIILVSVISLSPFVDFKKNKLPSKIFAGVVVVGVLIIVIQSLGAISWFSDWGSNWGITYMIQQNLGMILFGIIFLVAILVPIFTMGKKNSNEDGEEVVVRPRRNH